MKTHKPETLKFLFSLIGLFAFFFAFQEPTVAFPISLNAPSALINCRSTQGTTTDNSNHAVTGFAAGTATQVTWDGSRMVLNAGQTTGSFISRPIDSQNCHGLTPWLSFLWTTSLPYFKELPSTSETAGNYSAKTANLMANIQGIWHLNEASYNTTADEAVDSSGNGYHALLHAGSVTNVAGRFNNGFPSSLTSRLKVLNLPVMTEAFTYQTWLKTTDTTNYAGIAMRRDVSGYGFTLQMNQTFGRPYIRMDTSGGTNQASVFSTTTITDGNWHHVVVVVNSGATALWVDGTKFTGTYVRGTGLTAAGQLQIGWSIIGSLDEVAMWDRVLTDAEIIELYRRGANRVKLQVRTCSNSDCSDNPTWMGPDGTSATFFTEINNNSLPLTGLGNVTAAAPSFLFSSFPSVIFLKRYFQYKFILETDNTTYLPDLTTFGVTR